MSIQEHSVITFLKSHGKEIIERERQKYEPIKQESKLENKLENTYIIRKKNKTNELEELRKENIKLKTNTNMEWLTKYKFYKDKYKTQKKELKQRKLEVIQVREEIDILKDEIKQLRIELNNIKGKGKIELKQEIQNKNIHIESSDTEENEEDKNKESREIYYLEESENSEH